MSEIGAIAEFAKLGVTGLLIGIIVMMYRSFIPWLKTYADGLKSSVDQVNASLVEIRQAATGQASALGRLEEGQQRQEEQLRRVELDQARTFAILNEEQPSRRSPSSPPMPPSSSPARA